MKNIVSIFIGGLLILILTGCSIKGNNKTQEIQDLKNIIKQYEKEKKELLIGKYFTPDYAIRKIEFFNNNNFILNEDEENTISGTYELLGKDLILNFEDGSKAILEFYKGNDSDMNYYIKGEGKGGLEYFVKE